MKLPLDFLDSTGLLITHPNELIFALGLNDQDEEALEINRLMGLGLPPITSKSALAVMTGLNPGFIWSLLKNPHRNYRVFEIPKGSSARQIEAPRVALKMIQKWLSIHFERKWQPLDNIHGFVKGRSHLTAAQRHVSSKWIISLDIENFFPSTPAPAVCKALQDLGYQTRQSIEIIAGLCTYRSRLSQGAPTSPILSNICLHAIDQQIVAFAAERQYTFTRYADDLVLSGHGDLPEDLVGIIRSFMESTPWNISDRKIHIAQLPQRLKVHGLLVHGNKIRLTKGYRKRIRAFKHLQSAGLIRQEDIHKIAGHLNYDRQVENFTTNDL